MVTRKTTKTSKLATKKSGSGCQEESDNQKGKDRCYFSALLERVV